MAAAAVNQNTVTTLGYPVKEPKTFAREIFLKVQREIAAANQQRAQAARPMGPVSIQFGLVAIVNEAGEVIGQQMSIITNDSHRAQDFFRTLFPGMFGR